MTKYIILILVKKHIYFGAIITKTLLLQWDQSLK